MELQIRTGTCRSVAVLYLGGELDMAVKSELTRALAEAGSTAERLVVDLGEVTFADSSALGLLIDLESRLSSRGGMLALASLQPQVRHVFEVAGLFRLLRVFDDTDEAASYLGPDSDVH